MTDASTTDAGAAELERERARLLRLAARLLDDPHEAEDVVQTVWVRWRGSASEVDDLPAWATTVTTRLCLDRLKARVPVPTPSMERPTDGDVAAGAEVREDIGRALGAVVDVLTPQERVAFVLHDTFGVEHEVIATILDRSPVATRKLASRARVKLSAAVPPARPDWQVVDAFMAAAREGEFEQLLALLAPDAVVAADAAAVVAGTPKRIDGRHDVATFFDGSATATLPVLVGGRPGSAWFHRGRPMVAFDFVVADGVVASITFRADRQVLAAVVRRDGDKVRRPAGPDETDE